MKIRFGAKTLSVMFAATIALLPLAGCNSEETPPPATPATPPTAKPAPAEAKPAPAPAAKEATPAPKEAAKPKM